MKSIVTKERLMYLGGFVLLVAVLLVLAHFDNINRNEIYALINNPAFEGKVVDTSVVHRWGGSFAMWHTEYRLHIVGEYLYNDETVQIDRTFVVSKYLYDKFEIGDTIPISQ